MQKSIIVEGPDGVGKSILVSRLSKDLKMPSFHTGGATRDLAELTARCQEVILRDGVTPTVFDRAPFVSDNVYKGALGLPFLRSTEDLHRELEIINPVVILCQTAKSRISRSLKQHKPREYTDQVKSVYPKVLEGYASQVKALQERGISVLFYDWMEDWYEVLLAEVKLCAA